MFGVPKPLGKECKMTTHFSSREWRILPVAMLICLFSVVILQTVSAEPLTSMVGQNLMETINAGIPFEGMTASLDGASVWPGKLFIRLQDNNKFDGHLEWTSLDHVNYIEGTITETGEFVEVDFESTRVLVKGTAASGVSYHCVATLKDGQVELVGKWFHGQSRGPCVMGANAGLAGQQSTLLEGKTLDEILDRQTEDKLDLIFEDDCIDWKLKGYKYTKGGRMCRLSCNWARDRLREGISLGELVVVFSDKLDKPILAFTHKSKQWKQVMDKITYMDLYFSREVEYRIPVQPNTETGYVMSTESIGKVLLSLRKDGQHIDSDVIIEFDPALQMGSTYISTKSFDTVWKAQRYLMRGETPPPMLQLMEED